MVEQNPHSMIPATRPYLPPVEDFEKLVRDIWHRRWLTNHGILVQRFESEIAEYFDLPYVTVVNSGTTGLLLALQSLPAGSEVITTPFSYVATTSTISWQGLEPIFADIEPDGLTIDPEKVREKITDRTSAILATHVFGNPCDIEALEALAEEHGLVLIFDAAHCFGTGYRGKSVLRRGDISVLSFHATKLFHAVSGGLIISKTAEAKDGMDRKRNFGHAGQNVFHDSGINGKMDEFQAGMGLLNLQVADELISRRREQWYRYRTELKQGFELMVPREEKGFNGAYFPIFLPTGFSAEDVLGRAEREGIELRRYFHPALNKLDYVVNRPCPVAENKAGRVLCLPMYHDLNTSEQDKVIKFLSRL